MNSNKINVDRLICIVSSEIRVWHFVISAVVLPASAIVCNVQSRLSPFCIDVCWGGVGLRVSLFLFCFV